MSRLETELFGIKFKNPVIAASGTFGFGAEYGELIDISRLGGISGKGLTLKGGGGNSGVRIWESAAGLMNSIGLENPGVAHFVEHESRTLRASGAVAIANLGGHCLEDYIEGAELLNGADIDLIELNISCPNLRSGGMAFGMEPCSAAEVTREVKKRSKYPVAVKLTPNAPDIVAVAMAVEDAGADGVCLVNTFLGMAIDIEAAKPVFENVYAGLSGPAIMPMALRIVHQAAKRVKIPIIGLGGIASAGDAIAFMMAGASAVEVGTATFARPAAMLDIIDGMEAYLISHGIESIADIVGIV